MIWSATSLPHTAAGAAACTLTIGVDPHCWGSDVSCDCEVRNPQILKHRRAWCHWICNLARKLKPMPNTETTATAFESWQSCRHKCLEKPRQCCACVHLFVSYTNSSCRTKAEKKPFFFPSGPSIFCYPSTLPFLKSQNPRDKKRLRTRVWVLWVLLPVYMACNLYCMVVKRGDISAGDAEQFCWDPELPGVQGSTKPYSVTYRNTLQGWPSRDPRISWDTAG